MAESQPLEGSSSLDVSGGSSGSTLQLNIKTLDSRIYSFHVDKNILVSAFKGKIAIQSGVPVGQQRLIFRGKVLKDNHLLSEYNAESGDTFHLVERQPHPSTGSSTREETTSHRDRGQDSNAGGPRNRIGPIAHSIVLGTLNVGDPGEAVVPDLSRVIGSVLNNIGIGNNQAGAQPGVPVTSHGNETEGSQANAGSQNQGGNQSAPWQASYGQSAAHVMQFPLGAAIAVPSLNMRIPDSLNTLVEFIKRMELAFSQNGERPIQSTTTSNQRSIELPSNSFGLPTAEAMSIVLRHVQRLLTDHAAPALSHTASRLTQEMGSNDPTVRGQVQTESIRLGMAMQHLGALLLELGRTILTLRMGQSPSESFVNAGPAVYISPSGPNPIMVQPFPLQTRSLFGGSSGISPNPAAMGPVGVSNVPRNVNIHIHAGTSLAPIASTVGSRAPNEEGMQRECVNLTGSDISVPSQPSMASVSGAVPSRTGVQQTTDSNSTSSIISEITDLLRSIPVTNVQSEHAQSGQTEGSAVHEQTVACDDDTLPHVTVTEDQKAQAAKEMGEVFNSDSGPSISSVGGSYERSSASNQGNDSTDHSSGVPLGLGLGGLQPKGRGKQPRAQTKDIDRAITSSQNQQSRAVGQQVLQSLASISTRGNPNPLPLGKSPDLAREVGGSGPTPMQNASGQGDVADAMSQILRSPALDGLLSGVSQQTGVGSPDMLRSVLQQFTQNPAMMSTVNQIAQQMDGQDLGSMFLGLDRGPGAGIDLSSMMPIVSKALGVVSSVSQSSTFSEPVLSETISRREMMAVNDGTQRIHLQQVVQSLENQSSSEEVFSSLVDSAENIYAGSSAVSVVNQLCSQGGLAEEFMEMLRRDVSQRFPNGMGS